MTREQHKHNATIDFLYSTTRHATARHFTARHYIYFFMTETITDTPARIYEGNRLVVTLNCYETAIQWIALVNQAAFWLDVPCPKYEIKL